MIEQVDYVLMLLRRRRVRVARRCRVLDALNSSCPRRHASGGVVRSERRLDSLGSFKRRISADALASLSRYTAKVLIIQRIKNVL